MAAFMIPRRAGKFLQHLVRLHTKQAHLLKYGSHTQGYLTLSLSSGPVRGVHLNGVRNAPMSSSSDSKELSQVEETETFRERFVPITRKSIVRHMMQEKDFLTDEELRKFETFSLSLDTAIVNRYHGLLQELKALFDPINPDKDTIATRKLNKRELLDNEFWLLQKLANVMEKANFHELPKSTVESCLAEHSAREGVLVSVNTDKYDVLRFWALGRETPEMPLPFSQKMINMIMRRPAPKPITYFKRVVAAVRLKKDDKLLLKAFKEVPVNTLEQLLPDGKIKMSKLDRGVIMSSAVIAGAGILGKVVTWLAGVHVDWTLVLTGVTGLIGVQAWTTYKNRHLKYINDSTRMLYFKNIANNRGLLTLLIDRAEDELFKEALLTYTFLLTNRPPSAKDKGSSDQLPAELGAVSALMLEKRIEEWVFVKTGHRIEFESSEASHLLEELGLLSTDLNQDLFVLPLDAAMRNLPQQPQSITARIEEHDIVEGYDHNIYDEKEEDYQKEEKKRRRFGWF